jgi:hypothetical protein
MVVALDTRQTWKNSINMDIRKEEETGKTQVDIVRNGRKKYKTMEAARRAKDKTEWRGLIQGSILHMVRRN